MRFTSKNEIELPWPIVQFWIRPKPKLNCWDISDHVQFMTKTRHGNHVTDCTGAVNNENNTELLWSIRPGAVCDENKRGQWHDWLYRCALHRKWYWTSWSIESGVDSDQSKIGKLHDWSYKYASHRKQNWSIMVKSEKDVTNRVGTVYTKHDIEL